MILQPSQIKELCQLYKLSIRQRHYIFLQNYVASVNVMRQVWNVPASFMLPRDFWLNVTRDPETTEYTRGYLSEELAIKDKNFLIRILKENACYNPEPRISIEVGWQILFNGAAVGPKLDFGTGGKKGLSFPPEFYSLENVIFSKESTIKVLKGLIAYIVDHLQKKKEWSGLKDHNGKILEKTKLILKS